MENQQRLSQLLF